MNEGQSILVTGGTGFLGRHLSRRLSPYAKQVESIGRRVAGDLLDCDKLTNLLIAHRIDVVFHLASNSGGIGYNEVNPACLLYDNAMLALNSVEACRRANIKKLVTVGSVCAYPVRPTLPFKEETIWDGYPEPTNAPYGVAKRLLIALSQAYRQQYGMSIIHVVPTNLYGPGDCFEERRSHVIPALIRRLVEAKEKLQPLVEIWGDGSPSREFLYVVDAAEAIALAAERYDSPEPLNLGTGIEVTISWLANHLRDLIGYCGELVYRKDRPNGQPRRCLDVSRAQRALDWSAGTPLLEGLSYTVNWYLQHRTSAA